MFALRHGELLSRLYAAVGSPRAASRDPTRKRRRSTHGKREKERERKSKATTKNVAGKEFSRDIVFLPATRGCVHHGNPVPRG